MLPKNLFEKYLARFDELISQAKENQRYEPRGKPRLLFRPKGRGIQPKEIESEISADYMGQAEQLLREGQTGQYDHVPAAVLCGAVLEKALRTLYNNQNTPISTIKNDETHKTLNPLIDDLKKQDFSMN